MRLPLFVAESDFAPSGMCREPAQIQVSKGVLLAQPLKPTLRRRVCNEQIHEGYWMTVTSIRPLPESLIRRFPADGWQAAMAGAVKHFQQSILEV